METFYSSCQSISRRFRRPGVALGVAAVSFALMATRPPAESLYTIQIHDNGTTFRLLSEPMTLQKRFLESRIRLSRFDEVKPSLSTVIRENMTVRINRGAYKSVRASSAAAPAPEKIIYSRRVPAGQRIKIHTGRTLPLFGEETTDTQKLNIRRSSRDIVLVGEGKSTPKQKVFHLMGTAYSPDVRDCWPYSDGITALGLKAGYGVAAVDPRVIPLGTRVYVEGYGYAIASDLGGAIRGREIDLCFDTHDEAKKFGRRSVTVYLLD